MIYKDMTFCTAKNCGKLDCPRNTNGPNFNPKSTDWISWIGFENCTERRSIDYKKEKGK